MIQPSRMEKGTEPGEAANPEPTPAKSQHTGKAQKLQKKRASGSEGCYKIENFFMKKTSVALPLNPQERRASRLLVQALSESQAGGAEKSKKEEQCDSRMMVNKTSFPEGEQKVLNISRKGGDAEPSGVKVSDPGQYTNTTEPKVTARQWISQNPR